MKKSKIIVLTFFVLGLISISTGLIINQDERYYKNVLKEYTKLVESNTTSFDRLDIIKKKINRISNSDNKELLTEDLNNYIEYITTKEKFEKYYKSNMIDSNITDDEIKELKHDYNNLSQRYKKELKPIINEIIKQKNNLDNFKNDFNNLYENDSLKENITKDDIKKLKNKLSKIPQKDIYKEYTDKLNSIEKTIDEKIEASWVKLNVPYISQNKNDILNGCEAACMLMALQYKGYLKDMSLKEYVKLMPLSPDTDAEKGFTHDMYSLDPLSVPHWIAPEPLKKFGIDTSGNQNIINGTGMSIDELDKELDNGNPVIIYLIAKFNPPKETVEGVPRNLHVMLLTGYNKMTGEHYIVDPWTHDDGRTSRTVSKELIIEKYELLSKRNVIIR